MSVKQTVNAISGIVGETVYKTLGQPFTLPIKWIEGEKGAAGRMVREAGSSLVQMPFRLTWEVLKGMLRGGWSVAQLAVHLPWIPSWNKERQDVMLATRGKLGTLEQEVDHSLAA